MISEWACCEMRRISCRRYFSGIQSFGSMVSPSAMRCLNCSSNAAMFSLTYTSRELWFRLRSLKEYTKGGCFCKINFNETGRLFYHENTKAQKIINEKDLSIAQNERLKAEEFAKAAEAQTKMVELKIRQMEAEAKLESAKRWDGKAPGGVVPSNSPFLFQFGSGK